MELASDTAFQLWPYYCSAVLTIHDSTESKNAIDDTPGLVNIVYNNKHITKTDYTSSIYTIYFSALFFPALSNR